MKKVKLGDVCDVFAGQGAPQGNEKYCNYDSGIPFIKAGDLGDLMSGKSERELQCVDEAVAKECKLKLYQAGSVLFAKSGMSCMKGYVYCTKEPCYVVSHLAIITPKKVEKEYLKHYFQYYKPNTLVKDSAYPSISLSDIANMEILLPSIEEQKEIADRLDKVIGLIEKRKEQLAKLDQLVKSRFIEMFGDPTTNPMGWDEVNISAVVGGKVSNGFFAKRDDYYDDGNVQVLGVANVVNRMYSNTEGLSKTNGTEADIAKYGVKYGDMLFCRSSLVAAGIGKASIVPHGTPNNVLFECHVIRLPLDLQKCVPEFMQVLSTTDYFRNQVISQSKTATMTTIGQDGILKTDIILPPLDLQKQFLKFVEQTGKSKFEIQQSIDKLETLKKSLMQQYFR